MTTNPLAGKKILFANFPADGHFNPLTGLALHLKKLGCEVRWYSSNTYSEKIKQLQIHHYPFQRAVDVPNNDFDKAFPDRLKYKTQISRLKFDIINAFILRGPEYYTDILNIYSEYRFELLVADCTFTGIPFVKAMMNVPVIAIGVLPLNQNSKDLPPSGLGMQPSYSIAGKIKQAVLRKMTNHFIFKEPNEVMHSLFDRYGIKHNKESIFDMQIKSTDLLLQTGTPGLEYYRSDMSRNVRFIGPLLPHSTSANQQQWFDDRLNKYRKIVLVTQGTVEKDVTKIIEPALEAFKGTDTLVIATTGGTATEMLRKKYPQQNLIIEDFIPFADVMPYADVYITNGGYGGVMLAVENKLPMVVAGIHEGKNEINARIGYFEYGINLRTERPEVSRLRNAVNEVISNKLYRYNIDKLAAEFTRYNPELLFTKYVKEVLKPASRLRVIEEKTEEKIY